MAGAIVYGAEDDISGQFNNISAVILIVPSEVPPTVVLPLAAVIARPGGNRP